MRLRILLLVCIPLLFICSISNAERRISEETLLFRKVRDAVVTVSADEGSGSGFLVDSIGIVLTNDHVVGGSARIRVKLNDSTRVDAKLLASDPRRDIAAIWIAPSRVLELPILPLAIASDTMVFEGEKVIAIGSPLNQERVMTAGIVSKVVATAIISDVNINYGNSGGPLLNMDGAVIAINTFVDFTAQGGPGISGSVMITEAAAVVAEARLRVREESPPSDSLLPVASRIPFPLDSLRIVAGTPKLDTDPYYVSEIVDTGKFEVVVVTPVFDVWRSTRYERKRAEYVAKRERKGQSPEEERYDPQRQMREWQRYTSKKNPAIVTIQITPEVGETSGSVWRNLLGGFSAGLSRAPYRGSHKYEFKADFKDVTVLRYGVEIPDILRGRFFVPLEFATSTWTGDTWGEDFARAGIFVCDPGWFAPTSIGYPKIRIRIVSVEKPDRPTSFLLPEKTVQRVWEDFAAYRGMSGEATTSGLGIANAVDTAGVLTQSTTGDSLLELAGAKAMARRSDVAGVTVTLTNGASFTASAIRPASMGALKIVHLDGKETFLDGSQIRSIVDSAGVDWTERVLTDRERYPPK